MHTWWSVPKRSAAPAGRARMPVRLARWLRWLFCGLLFYSGLLRLLRWVNDLAGRRLTILLYHRVDEAPGDPLSRPEMLVGEETFRRQMEYVRRRYRLLTIQELETAKKLGRPLPPGSLLVTFDDGYWDNFTRAFPILRHYRIPAVVFLATDYVGDGKAYWWDECYAALASPAARGAGRVPAEADPELRAAWEQVVALPASLRGQGASWLIDRMGQHPTADVLHCLAGIRNGEGAGTGGRCVLTWDEVAEMHRAGIDFRPHSESHANLERLPPEGVRREIAGSRQRIEARLPDASAESFAYPSGRVSDVVRQELLAQGFACAFSNIQGMSRWPEETLRLRRWTIWDGGFEDPWGRFSLPMFAVEIAGGLDLIRGVAGLFPRRQSRWGEAAVPRSPGRAGRRDEGPPDRIRVAHIVPSLDFGGLESVVLNVTRGTKREEFAHSIYCLFGEGPRAEVATRTGVAVRALQKGSGFDWRIVGGLAGLLRRDRIDILHAHDYGTMVYAVLAGILAGIRAVVKTEHGAIRIIDEGKRRKDVLLSRACARVVAVSESLKQEIVGRGVPAHKVRVIRNGIAVAEEARLPLGQPMRASLGVTGEGPVVCHIGSLRPEKNQAILIPMARSILRRVPGVTFLVAGDGPCGPSLREAVGQAGLGAHIRLLGDRSDVHAILAASDVFVHCSLHEGLGLAILEAMTAGVPVVATAVDGVLEIVRDGVNGLLVPPGDAEALAEAVLRLLGDPALGARLASAGRATVASGFTLERMAREYEELYRAVLREAR